MNILRLKIMLLLSLLPLLIVSCKQSNNNDYCEGFEKEINDIPFDTILIGTDSFHVSYYMNPKFEEKKLTIMGDTVDNYTICLLDSNSNIFYYIGILNTPNKSLEDFINDIKQSNIIYRNASYYSLPTTMKIKNGRYEYINFDAFRDDLESDYLSCSYYISDRGDYYLNVNICSKGSTKLDNFDLKRFKCFVSRLKVHKIK